MNEIASGTSRFRVSSGLKLLCLPLFILLLSGCIQDSVLIKLNPDGSGTIEETMLQNITVDEIMKQECGKNNCTERDILDSVIEKHSELAEENAGAFGDGVRLVAVKPVRTKTALGAVATYSFKDINKILVSKDPMARTAKGFMRGGSSAEDNITFRFTRDPSPHLVISMFPKEWAERGIRTGPDDDDDPDFELDKMDPRERQYISSGRLSVALEISGNITNADATYQKGNAFTLIDVSFKSVLEDKTLLKRFKTKPPRSIQEYGEAIRGIDGFRLELKNPVVIDFR